MSWRQYGEHDIAARLVEAGETEQAVGWLMAVIADDPYAVFFARELA